MKTVIPLFLIGFGLLGWAQQTAPAEPSKSDEPQATEAGLKIAVDGTMAGEFRLTRTGFDPPLAGLSDLYLRRLDIGIETRLNEWLTAAAVVNSQWLGDSRHPGAGGLALDEVHVDFRRDRFPVTASFGYRTQPFGLFENHLVSLPLGQEAYEAKQVGLTVGALGPGRSDFSLTLYKGAGLLDRLFAAGLFDAGRVQRQGQAQARQVNSFIAAASIWLQKEGLCLFGSYRSEPGAGKRNTTLCLGLHGTPPGAKKLLIDCEFMSALSRETFAFASKPYREAVFSLGASYHFKLRERASLGGGNYRERKSHIRSHPFAAALRIEFFLDNSMARELGIWTLKSRIGAGGRCNISERPGRILFAEAEFRRSSYRIGALSGLPDSSEYTLRLGVDF